MVHVQISSSIEYGPSAWIVLRFRVPSSTMVDGKFPVCESETTMELDEKDLVVTTFKSSGPGGQKKNKTESAVRIKHLPTGIIVTATESRSQLQNRERALERLRQRLAARSRRPRRRLPTQPGRAAIEKRLSEKKRRGEIKKGREKVDD
jgi:protein subunit release factor A